MTALPVVTLDRPPVLALVLPPGCGWPGCQHHYWTYQKHPDGCVCTWWPANDGWHLFAPNPLCRVHHTVMELIDDVAINLEMRGYLDPDEDETPPEIVAALLDLYLEGKCGLCPGWPSPSNLADHYLAQRQDEWERYEIAPWWCGCGAIYKPVRDSGRAYYYETTDPDGLLGELAGEVVYNGKGKVTKSGACPRCGVPFATTISDRKNPQQALLTVPAPRLPATVRGGPVAGNPGAGIPRLARPAAPAPEPLTLFDLED